MNWYKTSKTVLSQSSIYQYIKDNPIDVLTLRMDELPNGFDLIEENNEWYVYGPDGTLLVNREQDRIQAIVLAKMRIDYINRAIQSDLTNS